MRDIQKTVDDLINGAPIDEAISNLSHYIRSAAKGVALGAAVGGASGAAYGYLRHRKLPKGDRRSKIKKAALRGAVIGGTLGGLGGLRKQYRFRSGLSNRDPRNIDPSSSNIFGVGLSDAERERVGADMTARLEARLQRIHRAIAPVQAEISALEKEKDMEDALIHTNKATRRLLKQEKDRNIHRLTSKIQRAKKRLRLLRRMLMRLEPRGRTDLGGRREHGWT